jgi:hypothetical protein
MGSWSLDAPSRLHWKRFDPDWVVYEEASNQTAVLNTVEMDLLMCLSAGALESGQLVGQVLGDLELQDSDASRQMVNAYMSRLESVGLIKQIYDASFPTQSQ